MKGISTALIIVMAAGLALAFAAAMMFGVGPFLSSSEKAGDNVSRGVNGSIDKSKCIASCREDHPGGGPEFLGCRQSC